MIKYCSLFILSFCCLKLLSNDHSVTIGFGSCAYQDRVQPIWATIMQHNPDLFVLMGDNVYIDSTDEQDMKNAYQELAQKEHFQQFRNQVPIIATWDDHDYGINDGGKNFSAKHKAKQAFIEFFDYPEISQLKSKSQGIYHTKWLKQNDLDIQIILIDTRWDRDDLTLSYLTPEQRKQLRLGPYQPNSDNTRQLLGDQQWQWLKKELQKAADVKILVSSIQVIPEYSGWELWANFPDERKKLLDMLSEYSNNNLVIVSGDVHRGELSQIKYNGKTMYEVTSSGLAGRVYPAAPNKNRFGQALIKQNYGLIEVNNVDQKTIELQASLYSDDGKLFNQFVMNLENKKL
ncbi:alkaline phosphatase D family protein [Pleionea sediminis]|uniref:alkaline phosphatase D family protein n=1 Tax=Pleionea sediminis TaxID=2569479 RepID=UPI0011862946|nr:alkaline phosphatase D family protein [Pleionea sediminis]